MTELTQWQQPAQDVVTATTRGIERLVDWAQEADAAMSLAQRLSNTAFCPQQFRGKPADLAAAMLAGQELGLSPITSMGSFDVIQGRAAARAITLRGLVQAQGHEIVKVDSSSTRCTMKGRRRGSDEWQTVTWTIDRAKALGLTGKDNWKKQPEAMLIARATSELCRLIASDALLGIGGGYSTEEIADGATDDVTFTPDPVEPTTGGKTTVRRRRTTPSKTDDATPKPVDDAVELITEPQSKKLHAMVNERGLTREQKLAGASTIIGREIESTSDLTKEEAARVIDSLEQSAPTTEDPPFEEEPLQGELID